MPVTKDTVEVVEIVGGGIGGFIGVAAFVDNGVDFEAIVFSCGVHKLPEACGTHAGSGLGVHGGFDNGEVFQFLGYVVARKGFLKERAVVFGEGEHDVEAVAHTVEVKPYVGADLLVEGHGDDSVEGSKATGNDRVGNLVEGIVGVDIGTMAAGGGRIFGDEIAIEQAVIVGDELVGHVDGILPHGMDLCGSRERDGQQDDER